MQAYCVKCNTTQSGYREAWIGTNHLPLCRQDGEGEIRATLPSRTYELNLQALETDITAIK
jgi:hypothetical protein